MLKPLRFVLLGHPVGHSLSPSIHQAVYDAYQLPHCYELVDCASKADVERQIGELRAGRLAGINVTVPWKRLALELADTAHASARDTGAANVLVRDPEGLVIAHNTDAPALTRLIQRAVPNPTARAALVLGNGGAALAAVVAAKNAGFDAVHVSARRWHSEASLRGSEEFERLGAHPLLWGSDKFAGVAPTLGLIIQATSAGMTGVGGGEELASLVPWHQLPADTVVYDVVYNPPLTPFLQRAHAAGLVAEGGLSMLIGQAALAVELWLGIEPPLAAMTQQAEVAMGARHAAARRETQPVPEAGS